MNILRLAVVVIAMLVSNTPAFGVTDVSKIPVLHYHAADAQSPCWDYNANSHQALMQDLATINAEGFIVVPVYWIAQWVTGELASGSLPPWVVGITFSDGWDGDWTAVQGHPCSGYIPSFRDILASYKQQHPELPWYSPHASSFVIASPTTRLLIDDQAVPFGFGSYGVNDSYNEWWWPAASSSGLIEVYNHSSDHDHSAITSLTYDPALGINLPVTSYDPVNPQYAGHGNFAQIDSYPEAHNDVAVAASYINSRIGVWPDLFMCPAGQASSYLVNTYFPYYWSEHRTYAAFCANASGDALYLRRGGPRYAMTVFQHRADYTNAEALRQILLNSLRNDEKTIGKFYLKLLGRVGDSSGYGYWLGDLRAARCYDPNSVWSKLDYISSNFVWSQEFQNRGLSNSDYVAALYRGLLQREPDSGGWSWYTSLLDQGYSRETIRQYFIGSQEFYDNVVSPVMVQSCA